MQQNREQVHVSTVVRTKEIKNITIPNRTNMLWKLRPQVEGEYFSGQDTFVVEPQSTKAYEITYCPMTMTTEGKKHTVRSHKYTTLLSSRCLLIHVFLSF